MSNKRVLISYNTCWYVWNFRMPLIAALAERGYEVVVLAPRDEYTDRIVAAGIAYRDIRLDAKGVNLLRELASIAAYRRAYKAIGPAVVLQYTIKPNLYGSLAARSLGIPVVNNVTGLGAAFEGKGALQLAARVLYRTAFSRADKVFFQNPDDMATFLRGGLVARERAELLPGSGVDLQRFSPRAREAGSFAFLFMGRLLKAKGVEDLIAAARIVKFARPDSRIILLGKRDDADPGAADPKSLDEAAAGGLIELAGTTDDVRPAIAASDCVVLPSYYGEGTPRSLLEAAAMGKPLVAADSNGTREPVVDGVNGYLCRPRDGADLAEKMLAVADSPQIRRDEMGAASRKIAEERFDERIVIGKYIAALEELGL